MSELKPSGPVEHSQDSLLHFLYQFQAPTSPNFAATLGGTGERVFTPPTYEGGVDLATVLKTLKKHVRELDGAELVAETSSGLHYVFTSRVFRFKDDLYLGVDSDLKVIHLLSRSRTGYYDFNVNRQRVLRLIALIKSHKMGEF